MHDCAKRTKFTTKPRLREKFSNLWHLRVVFKREFFLPLLHWEFVHNKITICIFKAKLGGKMCSSDVVTHKGYYTM